MAGKKDIQFSVGSDTQKAVEDMQKLVAKHEELLAKQRQVNAEGKQGKGMLNDIAASAKGAAVGFVTGAASIGTFVKGIKAYNEELNISIQKQREFKETALAAEQMALKIANLPGRQDVSQEGLRQVNDLINKISFQTGVRREVVSPILFYSESAMGTSPRATSAATEIARFAGPAGLAPEEVRQVPKLFNLLGADTEEAQRKSLAQLYMAASNSIAETGEFLQPFIAALTNYMNRGFKYEEALARMTSAIDVTGSVAEAGEMSERLAAITSGRNKKAMAFLEKEARRQGKDFTSMLDPQRMAFVEGLWDQYSASGNRDLFKGEMDARGYEAMLALFSPRAKSKYAEILGQVGGATADPLNRMAADFQTTLMAGAVRAETQTTARQAAAGIETSGSASFWSLVENLQNEMRAKPMSITSRLGLALTPGKSSWILPDMEQRNMADALIQVSLNDLQNKALRDGPGSAAASRYSSLQSEYNRTNSLKSNPDFLNRFWQETGGLQNIQTPEVFNKEDPYMRTIMSYIETNNKVNSDANTKLIDAINRNTEAIKSQNTGPRVGLIVSGE